MDEQKKPVYKFADYPEGVLIPGQPIKKNIAKTMEVTELFSMYDVMAYIAKMDKGIADKEAELEGLKAMREAYMDEVELIETELGIKKAQEKWEKEHAESVQEEADKPKEAIESPYVDEAQA